MKRRKQSTALDDKRQALKRREEELFGQMEKHKRLIADAPRKAKQNESDRREKLMTLNARVSTEIETLTIPDRRASFHPAPHSKPLRLGMKRKRQRARAMFFCLFVLVAVLIGWLAKVLM